MPQRAPRPGEPDVPEPGPIELCLDDFRAGTFVWDKKGLAWYVADLSVRESYHAYSYERPVKGTYDPSEINLRLERAPWKDTEN